MRRTTTTRAIGMLAAVGLVTAGCAGDDTDTAASIEDMEPVTLRVSINEPENITNEYVRVFLDEVAAKTDGKVDYEVYYAGSLLAGDAVLTGVADGVADIGSSTPAFFPDDLPTVNWFQQFGSLASPAWPLGTLAESAAVYTFFQDNEDIKADYEDSGVVSIYNSTTPRADMICTKPSGTLAELEGLRIRAGGQYMAAEVEALGGVPQFLTNAEVYEALERGVLDCAANAGGSAAAFGPLGWLEVAPYFSPLTMASAPGIGLIMNKDLYDGLPDEVKQIIREAAALASRHQMEVFYSNRADFVDDLAAVPNGTFQDATELNDTLAEYQESILTDLAGTAPEGVEDPEALVEEYIAWLRDWEAKLVAAGLPDEGGLDASGFQAAPGLVDWEEFADMIVESVQGTATADE